MSRQCLECGSELKKGRKFCSPKCYWKSRAGKPNPKLKGRVPWNKGLHIQTNTGRTHVKKGQRLSPQTEFKKGSLPWNKGLEGWLPVEKHNKWTGSNYTYNGIHLWIRKRLGKPGTCEFCRKSGLKSHNIHWANKSGKYLRDKNDWLRLCVPCHKKYDLSGVK